MGGSRGALGAAVAAAVALLGVAVLAVAGVAAVLSGVDRAPRTPELPPPPAAAPPAAGVDVPPHDPAAPGRPQDRLAAWAEPLADATGIPPTALRAYGHAAARLRVEAPQCGVSWTALAGIGSVESDHGRFSGARLGDDGRSAPPIVGIPLDGRPGVREIRDTDGGRLDGDVTYDRAVGPLQFIPQTWARWGTDGDADGVVDPQDLDDAAVSAARYLCASAPTLASADGWWAAVLTYNRSSAYGQDVLDRADRYGRAA